MYEGCGGNEHVERGRARTLNNPKPNHNSKIKEKKLTASIDTNGFDRYLNWNLPALHHLRKNSIAKT
jgi:hypothetical protein